MLASLSASAISLSKKFLPDAEAESGLFKRLGAQTVVAATVRALQLLGRQFVLGRNIGEAMGEAASARKAQASLRFSYDMLGEGARTEADARRYLATYAHAIEMIGAGKTWRPGRRRPTASRSSSAPCSRATKDAQRERVGAELLPRVWQLIERAARANINLTIDAEESDRLELSLDVLEALALRIAREFPQWRGFGLAVQAYQTRALEVVDEVARIARQHGLKFMVRLVKGAYWDGEIKRAQELGLAGYPVFTHKHHTDISYLACARALIGHADVIYPQFATHNAGTIAAIVQMARRAGAAFEMQRLHGMGEGVYREVIREAMAAGGTDGAGVPVRVYAPVGEHRDLLAYLVRRLLENGANSSFVHQLADERWVDPNCWARRCVHGGGTRACRCRWRFIGVGARANSHRRRPGLARRARAAAGRLASHVACPVPEATRNRGRHGAWRSSSQASPPGAAHRVARARGGAAPRRRRARGAPAEFCGLLVKEALQDAGATAWPRCARPWTFLRYYADQAESRYGAPGAARPDRREQPAADVGRGVFVCISPWNFPLAIFAGPGGGGAGRPATRWPPSRPSRRRPSRWKHGRAAARRRRAARCAGAAARPGRNRGRGAGGHANTAGVVLHRLHGGRARSSTARWRPRTAPSCR